MKFAVMSRSSPMIGEIANGDRAVSRSDRPDRALFAVVDALGHGPEAALVSDAAEACLGELSLDAPLLDMMERLHQKLLGSRGAAITLCVLRAGQLEACAVGNVELRTGEVRFPLVFSAGILGSRVNKFHICRAPVTKGRFVLFSDGISLRTPVDDLRSLSPAAACDAIMLKYRRKEDDATVLVADVE